MKHCLIVLIILCFFRFGLLASNETDDGKVNCNDVLSVEAQRAVGGAVAKLGLALLEKLQPGSEQPNIIISPLSVSLALAELALGARNKTEDKLLEILQAKEMPNFHKTLSCLQEQLTAKAVKMASRLYLIPNVRVNQDFVDRALNLYKSEPAQLTSLEEVNRWVEEATKGHITNFMSSLPPNVVIMLINAIHFKGEWQSRFDSKFTVKDIFYIDKKTSVKVDMMMGSKYPLSMFVDRKDGTQVARFPFQGNMSLLVVMPVPAHGNLSNAAAKLNISDMYEHFQSEKSMHVKLPKFKLQYKQDLRQALTSMGLGLLFTGPDLSRIAPGPLMVSGVQHASSMELSEDGAEASAATSVTLVRTVPTFAVNMPFIFALVDDASYTPLFLGMITNPNPGATTEQSDDPKTETETIMKPSKVSQNDGTLNDSPHMENMLSYMLNMWKESVPQQFLRHQEMEDGN
ncbi:Alpha-2-antiplasmin [Labeo rohita]|nr:alpha-2-antiplasmin [Labeo rohita]KAI2651168.1 Alpha-2-antiplasmin [Labeo rohita]